MSHNDLINEVTRQLASRFQPNPLDIKKRVENLIEVCLVFPPPRPMYRPSSSHSGSIWNVAMTENHIITWCICLPTSQLFRIFADLIRSSRLDCWDA